MATENTYKNQIPIRLIEQEAKKKLIPKAGLVWSPLLKYPRNAKCFCGLGVKYKNCHEGRIKMAVPPDEAAELKKYVDKVISEGLNR